VLEADTDVIGHINGGHTALPKGCICALCEQARGAIEIVHNGNERAALIALEAAKGLSILHKVILGTDAPAGSGVQPLGILRTLVFRASFGGLNDGGLIAPGHPADFVFIDRPQHSAGKSVSEAIELGDIPGIGMVVIDGVVRLARSRNTPPADKVPEVVS